MTDKPTEQPAPEAPANKASTDPWLVPADPAWEAEMRKAYDAALDYSEKLTEQGGRRRWR